MTHQIRVSDKSGMPVLGMHITESHAEFDEQLHETLRHGCRHFELPTYGQLPQHCLYHVIRFAHKKQLGKHNFFITTSIPVPGDIEIIMAELRHLKNWLGYPFDLVYLENPVGLRGSDPMTLYGVGPDGTTPRLQHVRDLFQRRDGGNRCLTVTPDCITEDLRAVWTFMERMVLMDGLAHALGLKHFSAEQIECVLKGAVCRPEAVMVEINAYNPATEIIELCRKHCIPVVAAHPFGNPHHEPSNKIPRLLDHPSVVRIGNKVGVAGHVILVRALLQAGLRVVFTNTELLHASFLLQNIFRFTLSQGQMNQLGRLHKLYLTRPLPTFEFRCVLDPMWPFLIYDDGDGGGDDDDDGDDEGRREQCSEEQMNDDEAEQSTESPWESSSSSEAESGEKEDE